MASNTELLEQLTNAIILPGLDTDTLLKSSFEVKFKDQLEAVEDPEARQELQETLYTSYVEANKDVIAQGIAELKSAFSSTKVQVESIIAQAREAITTAAVPSVIGTAAPNPLREILEMKSKKETLETILAVASNNLVRIIIIAQKIDYKLPEPVVALIQSISTAETILAAIPTKLS